MLFLVVLVILFGLMIWLTVYPLGFPKTLLKLQGIDDLSFKLLLLGIATLNFFAAFVLEVGTRASGSRGFCKAHPIPRACLSNPFFKSSPSLLFAADRPGPRHAQLLAQAAQEESVQKAFQEAGEGAEPAAAILATP